MLGERGHTLVCGGLGGVMEAVCRGAIVALNGEGVIAIDGSTGTLSEVGHALDFDRPVAGLGTHDIEIDGFEAVDTPEGAVEYVERSVSAGDLGSS